MAVEEDTDYDIVFDNNIVNPQNMTFTDKI